MKPRCIAISLWGFLLFTTFLVSAQSIESSSFELPNKTNSDVTNQDWNQYRGANRNGVFTDDDLQESLNLSKANTLWKANVGYAYSGVVVSNSKLYTMWDEGDTQYLFCLDAESGSEVWRHRVDSNFVSSWGDGPMATPVILGDIVYSISSYGKLHAVKAINGKTIWEKDLQEDFGIHLPNYGYAASPLVVDDKVFVQSGGMEDFTFLAFNKNTGDLIWHSETDEPAYSSPFLIRIDGIQQIVFMSKTGLWGISPEDGKLFWKYEWESMCSSAGPMNSISPFFIPPNQFFVSGGAGSVTGAAVVQVNRKNEGFELHELWYNQEMNNMFNPSVEIDGFVYGFHERMLRCVDKNDGTLQWEVKGFGQGSLIAINGKLVVLSDKGKVIFAESNSKKFTEISKKQLLKGRCWTPPAYSNGRIYLRNQKELVCLDLLSE